MQTTCTMCGAVKPGSEFYPYRPTRCKACTIAQTGRYAKARSSQRRAYYVKYHASDKGRTRAAREKLKKYGATACELTRMRIEQMDTCPLCLERLQTPFIDHCHATGRVRGLLCMKCNTGIGLLRDDPAVARRVVAYLES